MKYALGIDFGGGSSKATLLAENGTICAENTVEYPTHYPKSGWAEQNPHDWYMATKENICAVIKNGGIKKDDIAAISLDAATHTAVLTDSEFNVLRPSIYWTDIRSLRQAEYLKENFGAEILNSVKHNPDTIWTLPQLMWIRDNEPDVWVNTKRIMFAKDYVRHMLTGDYVTDNIEAEGSMLFDYNKQCWSDELCGILGIDKNILPAVVKPTDIAGTVSKAASDDTGLAEGTPVLCGTTDTVMEIFASGAVECGQMTIKLATAGRICVITDKAYPNKNLINYSHFVDGLWYPGTATKSCAASYRWYRDTFGGDYAVLDDGAQAILPGSDGLIFSPYLNGELTPYSDPKLCASFVGVRSSHTKAHFTRAVLEGVAMSMLDCQNAIGQIGIPHNQKAVIIGGGAKSPLWRQITSDVLGTRLEVKKYADSSLGSAMLAGISAGFWDSPVQAVKCCNASVLTVEPNAENNRIYSELFEKYKKIHDVLSEVYHGS